MKILGAATEELKSHRLQIPDFDYIFTYKRIVTLPFLGRGVESTNIHVDDVTE